MTIEGNSTGIDIYPSQYVEIDGAKMHYIEDGYGLPILFLHGIPTCGHLWRHIFSHLTMLGQCIAPDLMGFGKSDKPDIAYSIEDHVAYLNKFIEALSLTDVLVVMHGFGSVVGLDYALKHVQNCRGLVFYEAFMRPLTGDAISLPYQEQVHDLLKEAQSHSRTDSAIKLVDRMLLQSMATTPSAGVMDAYRQPFLMADSAAPVIAYIHDMPKGDGRSKIDSLLQAQAAQLIESQLPVLLLYSVPGFITTMATVMWAKEHLPNLEVMEVGEELHLAQESNSSMMGESISIWLQGIEQQMREPV